MIVGFEKLVTSLNENQLNFVKKYIDYHFSAESDTFDNEWKHSIYCDYAKTITGLLAKCEVFTHDLPRDIVGIIEIIFRLLTSTTQTDDFDKITTIFLAMSNCEKYMINMLYIKLIDCYVQTIKLHKKTLSHFKHQSFYLSYYYENKVPFFKSIRKKLKYIKKSKKIGTKELKSFLKKNGIKKELDFITVAMHENDIGIINSLKTAYEQAEQLVLMIEKKYPDIISNGYKLSIWRKLVYRMPECIATILAVLSIYLWIKKVVM